jgi:hypothetical protein
MSENTVKPGLTVRRAKRAKRTVENGEFDAFVLRILAAYARRVAAGDIEGLAGLNALSSKVDAVLREAVQGLRKSPYSYSWDEIGQRLGVSRQAVQMRFGAKSDRVTLDRRIVEPGLGVTVATLVEVFAEHFPGSPVPSTCPACGFRYPAGVVECSTLATVRPLLFKRPSPRSATNWASHPRPLTWRNRGLLTGRLANDKGEYLYQLPDTDLPRPRPGRPPRNPTITKTTTTSTTRSAV